MPVCTQMYHEKLANCWICNGKKNASK